MIFLETLLQDLRYGVRTLWRNVGFTAVSILALAVGIGVNTVVFTAYKAFVARPLDGRDPDTLVNVALRLQSGATSARFSYPDYEAYRDGLRSFSGVIAFSIEELRLTDAGGAVARRSEESGSLIGRLGLVKPSATNTEIASTFIVSENYFSVLGVKPVTRPRIRRDRCVGARRDAGRADQRELLAAALRRRSRGAGEDHPPQWRGLHHRRHHAGGFHRDDSPSPTSGCRSVCIRASIPTATGCAIARNLCCPRVRPPRAGCQHGRGAGRGHGARLSTAHAARTLTPT